MLAVPEIDMIAAAFTFGVAASMKAVVEVDNSAVPDQLRSKFGTLSSQTCVPYLREIPVKLVRADYVGLVTESARRSSLRNPSLVRKIIKTESVPHKREAHPHCALVRYTERFAGSRVIPILCVVLLH